MMAEKSRENYFGVNVEPSAPPSYSESVNVLPTISRMAKVSGQISRVTNALNRNWHKLLGRRSNLNVTRERSEYSHLIETSNRHDRLEVSSPRSWWRKIRISYSIVGIISLGGIIYLLTTHCRLVISSYHLFPSCRF